MSKLNVFFEDEKVGTLYRDEQLVYSFSYSDEWLKDRKSFQLSLAMPLKKKAFGNKITLSFFENLLPEGEIRRALEKSQNFEGAYDFLKYFGNDCAGAIIVSPNESSPFKKSLENSKTKIEMKKIYQAIEGKRSVAEVIANDKPGYLSIAGAQDKFVAIYEKGEFFLPNNGQPTTHIVKVPIYRSGVKESVYNEYFCMKLASRVGLNVAHCEVVNHKNHPLLVVERYDRKIGDNITRLHQQDFCQAQGFISEKKSEANGGPSLKDNYKLIKSNVSIKKRSKSLFHYLDWICFNLLIGNNDSHSKNISFLLLDGKIELAPFYDLMCTAVYPKLNRNSPFMLGDRDNPNTVGRKQFEIVDNNLGLKQSTMAQRAMEMSEILIREKDLLAEEVKAELPHAKIHVRIAELISSRCKNLQRQGINPS